MPAEQSPTSERLHSLDAYRGLIMVSLAFVGFGLADTAKNHLQSNPDSKLWQNVQHQFEHVEWTGCAYWDLIQPSFMFMVGVSMAYSYAKRQQLGHSYLRMFGHAVCRSLILILLSIVLMSANANQTKWEFMNVLAQIGLGYTFVFLLWNRSWKTQAIFAVLILGGTAAIYETYSDAGLNLETGDSSVGVSQEWAETHLTNIRKPWHKNANIGHAIDVNVLNRFDREKPFEFNKNGYQTINFLPSIATMLFGLMVGGLLRAEYTPWRKLSILLIVGGLGLMIGQLLNQTGVCPSIKKIWTPAWAIFSTGLCCWILAMFYLVVDVFRMRWLALPLIVVGVNSILIYCMSILLKPWTARQLQVHFGEEVFTLNGQIQSAWEPTIQATMVGLVFWLVCLYCYRKKIHIAI